MYVQESVWALDIKSDQPALDKNSICRLVLKSQQQQQPQQQEQQQQQKADKACVSGRHNGWNEDRMKRKT